MRRVCLIIISCGMCVECGQLWNVRVLRFLSPQMFGHFNFLPWKSSGLISTYVDSKGVKCLGHAFRGAGGGSLKLRFD